MNSFSVLVALIAFLIAFNSGEAKSPSDFQAAWTGSDETFSLEQMEGDVVLLNLWATWYEPCKEEIPELEAIASEFESQGPRVIGVNIDRTVSDEAVLQFAADHGATFDLVRDRDNSFSRVYRTTGVPETVLIDRNGEVAYHRKGELEAGNVETRMIVADVLADKSIERSGISSVGFAAAFGAGLLSLLSPCVFPLILPMPRG